MLAIWQNVRFATAFVVFVPLAFVCLTLLVIGLAVLVLPRSRHPSAFRAMGILRQVVEVLVSGRQPALRS
ncbi:hypothetical protein ACFC09_24310 [Streptomyces sp. NPDC056161]|uniref:hypothetical protein n=1 Tax=Streptomyces sp. NPDC056161 TaxID=3345732 RepID=UPI0035E02EF1